MRSIKPKKGCDEPVRPRRRVFKIASAITGGVDAVLAHDLGQKISWSKNEKMGRAELRWIVL